MRTEKDGNFFLLLVYVTFLNASNLQGPVVRKLTSANRGLKVNQGFNTLV